MTWALTTIAAALVLYATVSLRLQRFDVSAAIVVSAQVMAVAPVSLRARRPARWPAPRPAGWAPRGPASTP